MQKKGRGVVVYFFDWIKVLYRKGVSGRERESEAEGERRSVVRHKPVNNCGRIWKMF